MPGALRPACAMQTAMFPQTGLQEIDSKAEVVELADTPS
jgi:hypothetical protein